MKVLFAMRKESVSKSISDMYYERYGETLEYKNVFFFKALIEEVKNNKTYDRIVIDEDLEEYRTKDIEQLDKALFHNIDRVTDEVSNAEIILVCTDRREKGDPIINKLFSIGIYNLLLGDDRNINPLCDIIRKPKTKKEAKQYLNIDTSLIGNDSVTRDEEVEEEQMYSIIKYYKGIENQPEKYVPTFDEIAKQYSRVQLKIIVSYLPPNVRETILKEDRYKYLATGDVKSNIYTTVAGAEPQPKQQITGTSSTPTQVSTPKKSGGIFGAIKSKLNLNEVNVEKKVEQTTKQTENEEKSQDELLARAKQEAEAREKAEKEKIEKQRIEKEKEEEAKKQAEAKRQAELLAMAKEEEKAREKAEKEAIKQQEKEKHEQEMARQAEIQESKARAEEQKKIEDEQRKIREAQEKLEEEKRRLKEEQEKLVNEQNKLRESANEFQTISQNANQFATTNRYNSPATAMKMVVLVGANKAGTTFMVNAISHFLANAKIRTSILDMTRDKSMFYLYNQDDKGMRKKAAECMQSVSDGKDIYLETNSSYLKVYTTVPGAVSDVRRSFKHRTIIDTVKANCDVIVVDADFSTPIDYFDQADAIFLVQDLDLLKMPDTTSFLRELKNRGMDMKKIRVLINKYVKTSLSPKQIIQALTYYTDPAMSYVDEILPSKVDYMLIPYNLNNYAKYTDSVRAGTISFKGYSEDFIQAIGEIQKMIASGSNTQNKGRKLFG